MGQSHSFIVPGYLMGNRTNLYKGVHPYLLERIYMRHLDSFLLLRGTLDVCEQVPVEDGSVLAH